jgi:uncharacterized protein (DUF1330 family)
MTTYFIAQINVNNQELYAIYLDDFDRVLDDFGGKRLAADHNAICLEGEWPFERTILLEFEDKEKLLAWYHSDEYQHLLQIRNQASEARVAIIEGS